MGGILMTLWKSPPPGGETLHSVPPVTPGVELDPILHKAAASDDKDLLLAVLNGSEWGEEANCVDGKHVTALHLAASRGHLGCVRILLDYGADSNVQDTCGLTPLHEAASRGHAEVIEEIVNAQGYGSLNTTDAWGWTPLQRALMNFHYRTAVVLLEHGCGVNIPDEVNRTALHVVASYGHVGMASRLISKGAKVNHRDSKGWTPLMLAVVGGHLQVVRDLIHNGSDVNIRDFKDFSPLQLCAKGLTIDKYKCALVLIEAGAKCIGSISLLEDFLSRLARGVRPLPNLEASVRLIKLVITAVGSLPASVTQKAVWWEEEQGSVDDYSMYLLKMVIVAGTLSLCGVKVADSPRSEARSGPRSERPPRECPTLRDISRCSVRRRLADVHGNVLCAMKNADLPFGLKEIILLRDI